MTSLRSDAVEIWTAGVDAVRARPLVSRSVSVDGNTLRVGDSEWSRSDFDRVLVVGAGKAGTSMAKGLLDAIGDWLPVSGWVNVPSGTERELTSIRLHPARPAGVNEPTEQGVAGTREILGMVRQAGPRDLCFALLSGGGSALLPAPCDGVTLDDKLQVTRFLSGAGANINELNTVRKHLSAVKGGGLLRACHAGTLVTLVLSDVLGDPLDVIASGPTVADKSSARDALDVLDRFDPSRNLSSRIYEVLKRPHRIPPSEYETCRHQIFVIGNNAIAVDHAGLRAEGLGYNHVMHSATHSEGAAEEIGRHLADMALSMCRPPASGHTNDCLITGGEPTVRLVPSDVRGRGGRNQQLVLAAYEQLAVAGLSAVAWEKICVLSGGTDGEDGPTDAAGAVLDSTVHRQAVEQGLNPQDFLSCNNAYEFFRRTGGLLMTGPTGTNVCDIRVAVVNASSTKSKSYA